MIKILLSVIKMEKIGFCGLYCGDCPSHTGVIANLSRDLRKELRNYHFDKTAQFLATVPFFKEFQKYPDCYQVLGALVKLRCRKACRDGGGNPWCKIRKCALKKNLTGCWECADFESCDQLKALNPSHSVAHIQNLQMIHKKGIEEFKKGKKYWYLPKLK